MSIVGDNPLYRLVNPSYRAILTNPSHVPLMCRLDVCSTTQSSRTFCIVEVGGATIAPVGEARHNPFVEGTQKTSRQQAVTPRSGRGREMCDIGERLMC